VAASAVRDGAWTRCDVTGWPDNQTADGLAAWTWSAADTLTLVVVNLSAHDADGVVHIGHTPAAGGTWVLTDLLDGTTYERSGDDLAAGGMYVSRPPWGTHVLRAEPMSAVATADSQDQEDAHDVDG